MTNLATYTETELDTLRQAVIMSGHAVIFCEFTIVSMEIEIKALGQEITGAARNYSNSPLIQALFANYSSQEQTAKQQEIPTTITPESVLQAALDLIKQALAVLAKKGSPADIQDFKQFTYACADRVANAAGEGLFGTGEKVSKKEAATLKTLKSALGLYP